MNLKDINMSKALNNRYYKWSDNHDKILSVQLNK